MNRPYNNYAARISVKMKLACFLLAVGRSLEMTFQKCEVF